MLAMAAFLLPALPGGGVTDDAARIAYIANHPTLFRLGWLPWQLTAASDLFLSYAILRTAWIPRKYGWIALVLTILAVVPDQFAQAIWVTLGVDVAQRAQVTHDLREYLSLERVIFPLTGAWAALLYTVGAVAWTAAFARGGAWSRALTRLSAVLWPIFGVVTVGPLLPAPWKVAPGIVAAGNAIGFVLLELWFVLVLEQVMRRSRPGTAHGRWAEWKGPTGSLRDRLLEVLANSRATRAFCAWLPVFAFRSDITDVVYVNYLVEADKLAAYVPEALELQRLGPGGRWAMFTFLTYNHGNFGPSVAGPARRLFPSPVQSNWRTYVRDPRTGREGIYFTTNAITTGLHSIGARLMAEGLPMHLLAGGEVSRDEAGRLKVTLEPGSGSGPDAVLELWPTDDRVLTGPWAECFADYDAMLRYTVPQDRAMSTQPWDNRTTRSEIDLGIPLESCEPLQGLVRSRSAERVAGDAKPLCFRVPRVPFHFTGESVDRW